MGKRNAQFFKMFHSLTFSKAWDSLPYSAQSIYIKMQASWKRRMPDGTYINTIKNQVRFGLSDMPGMHKDTFRKGIDALRIAKLIKMIEPGTFRPPKKGLYAFINDWKWNE